ncbi:hypothetical protein [Burkholderia mayonis]|uniref:hypothetical protein n=1 Tax=Burkholderia mayonis TaxID=1385591 RepID=UPI00131EF6AA|nr:hypothetical protein [Burkholderia mayonis]
MGSIHGGNWNVDILRDAGHFRQCDIAEVLRIEFFQILRYRAIRSNPARPSAPTLAPCRRRMDARCAAHRAVRHRRAEQSMRDARRRAFSSAVTNAPPNSPIFGDALPLAFSTSLAVFNRAQSFPRLFFSTPLRRIQAA